MGQGSLGLHITDLPGDAVPGKLRIDFVPAAGSPGGAAMEAVFPSTGATRFIVEDLPCRGGPGTLYRVRITQRNFSPYAFFQLIRDGRRNTPSDTHIRLVANHRRVKDIDAPAFSGLKAPLRRFLETAAMRALEDGDRDLLGLTGGALYDALGGLRRACLLNIFAKSGHASAARCFRFLRTPMVIRQDRFFCEAGDRMPELLRRSERFKSAPNQLHQPLAGYRLEDSFKSRDAHANLQVTFQRHEATGALAADVDIDEASGIEHGFEVIRNTITKGRTNPYRVRELLLLFDPVEPVLDPGYRFVFK